MFFKKNNALLFFITGVIFFLLNYFTPLLHDDLAYLYQYGPKAEVRPTNFPVKNIEDVFKSQYYHYLDVNGRFFSHFLLQFFLLLGKNIFNIFNVIIFLGFGYFIHLYTKEKKEDTFLIFLFIFISFWFLMPFFGQTILWTTGAINYLWTSCFTIFFLLAFQQQEENPSKNPLKIILLFFMSLCIGWMNESVTFGVSSALFFYWLFHIKSITRSQFLMLVGFGIGVLFIVFSPGTFNRVSNEVKVATSFKAKILDVIAIFYLLKWHLLITLFLLIFLMLKKQDVVALFKGKIIIILAVIFNAILVFLVGNIEERMLFGNSAFLLVLNVSLFKKAMFLVADYKKYLISFVLLILLVYGFFISLSDVKNYQIKHSFFENEIRRNSKNNIVYFPDVKPSRFVNHTVSGINDTKTFHNRVRAFYYNVPEVNTMPENLFKEFFPQNNIYTEKYLLNNWDKPVYRYENVLILKMPSHFVYKKRLMAKANINNQLIEKSVNLMKINNEYCAFIENINNEELTMLTSIKIENINFNFVKN